MSKVSFNKVVTDSKPTFQQKSVENVGGRCQEWGSLKENIGLSVDCPNMDLDMGDLEYGLNKINRLNCPIRLDPQNSTFFDVAAWMFHRRRLSISTVEKHIRYARFMENHIVPVDFMNPSQENFEKHMDYREIIESASPFALKHEWKCMQIFLQAFGIPVWSYKPPIEPKHKKRNLPFPETVHEFFCYPFSKDEYETALYQYMFFHSFMIGWRLPSELCELRVSDVSFDKTHGTITITETKKHKSKRTIVPEQHVLCSKSHKSLKNYIDIWRPKAENQHSGDALYLQSNGKPFTVRHLGHKLSQYGKKVWPHFQPYDCRHWCAVSRLIETKITTGDFEPYTVKNWLGHERLKTTESYISHAEQYYNQFPKSWIHSALRVSVHNAWKWGKRLMDLKTRVKRFTKTLPKISPITGLWAWAGPFSVIWSKLRGEFARNLKLWFLSVVKSLSLKKLGVYCCNSS